MSKEPSESAADATDTPKKKSKLMLALFAAVPLVLAGAGYGAWMLLLAGPAADAAHAAKAAGDGQGAPDTIQVTSLPLEIAAETSFTNSYALSVVIERQCGTVETAALQAASEEEVRANGALANLSWVAATRRAAKLMDKNCNRLLGEVEDANEKAARIAAQKAEPEGKAAKSH